MTPQHVIIIVSALGGVIGGMGMGGGTLLIPLLTLAAGLEQHLAQAINLMAFVPMSIVALAIHGKNGYVRIKAAAPVALLAAIGAVCGSMLSSYAGGRTLRMSFGVFLGVLGIVQLIKTIASAVKKSKAKKKSAAPAPCETK